MKDCHTVAAVGKNWCGTFILWCIVSKKRSLVAYLSYLLVYIPIDGTTVYTTGSHYMLPQIEVVLLVWRVEQGTVGRAASLLENWRVFDVCDTKKKKCRRKVRQDNTVRKRTDRLIGNLVTFPVGRFISACVVSVLLFGTLFSNVGHRWRINSRTDFCSQSAPVSK